MSKGNREFAWGIFCFVFKFYACFLLRTKDGLAIQDLHRLFFKTNHCGDYGKNLHLNGVMGANIAVANDPVWPAMRNRPLNLEKRKMSFILFHKIHDIFLGTDCRHYTFIRHSISHLHIRQRLDSPLSC
jgi:hypothetical protein